MNIPSNKENIYFNRTGQVRGLSKHNKNTMSFNDPSFM